MDVIDISGQLDAFAARGVRAELRKLTDAGHHNLILNFQNVECANSTIVGIIMAVARQVRILKVFGMKPDIRKVFDLVGASRLLEIFDTEQEALNSFP